MPIPLYTTDVQKIVDRTPKTTLLDTDVFVVADKDGTLAPITKPNAKTTLGISDAESAITEMKGPGWTDENLVELDGRVGVLEQTLCYESDPSFRRDIELVGAVMYGILTVDGYLLGSHDGKLKKFDTELQPIWTRDDILLTGIPEQNRETGYIFCPTASGLVIVDAGGVDVDTWDDYGSCTGVAILNPLSSTSSVFTIHDLGVGEKSIVHWNSSGVEQNAYVDDYAPTKIQIVGHSLAGTVNRAVYVTSAGRIRNFDTGLVQRNEFTDNYMAVTTISPSGEVWVLSGSITYRRWIFILNHLLSQIGTKQFLPGGPISQAHPYHFDNQGRLFGVYNYRSNFAGNTWGYITKEGKFVDSGFSEGVLNVSYSGIFDNKKYLYIQVGTSKTVRYTQYHQPFYLEDV